MAKQMTVTITADHAARGWVQVPDPSPAPFGAAIRVHNGHYSDTICVVTAEPPEKWHIHAKAPRGGPAVAATLYNVSLDMALREAEATLRELGWSRDNES